MLRVAVPNKGSLSESAAEILSEAGYRRRTDSRDLTVLDPANQVEFFFLRPKDIAIYVGSGELDLGITGRDLAGDDRHAGGDEGLAGDAGIGIGAQEGVHHRVGDAVGDLVRMALGHALAGEDVILA